MGGGGADEACSVRIRSFLCIFMQNNRLAQLPPENHVSATGLCGNLALVR